MGDIVWKGFIELEFIKSNKTSSILKIMCNLPNFGSEDVAVIRLKKKRSSKKVEGLELIVTEQLLLESSV
ncbi:hypothetical protein MUO66_10230 [Candidatus Bathyarchaeota archaeon]|nr:hypothetical protein [Candidatus Bathyarchaeota archaeon]